MPIHFCVCGTEACIYTLTSLSLAPQQYISTEFICAWAGHRSAEQSAGWK